MRLLPARPLPAYAYLPGRFPHPIRDPRGHSFSGAHATESDPQAFRWGADLFNQGYHWEAHEAWEADWRLHPKGGMERDLLHGLILMAAAGVKLREHKWDAARRHGTRAATYLRQADGSPLSEALGWQPSDLAAAIELVVLPARSDGDTIAFDFTVGCELAPELIGADAPGQA